MYKIEEIPENTLPSFKSKIYPEFDLVDGFIKTHYFKEGHGETDHDFCAIYNTFIKINRDGDNYLIPYLNRVRHGQIGTKHPDDVVKLFKKRIDREVQDLKDNFIIPNEDSLMKPLNGCYSIIYKYKKKDNEYINGERLENNETTSIS